MFKSSANEFKNLRTVTAAALLIALHTVLSFLSINISTTMRVSVSFIANCMAGLFFGPVVGLLCGGLGDIVGFIVKPTGPFFPGWTINAALAAGAYGIAFYKRYPKDIIIKNGLKEDVRAHADDKKDKVIQWLAGGIILLGVIVWMYVPFISFKDVNASSESDIIMLRGVSAFKLVRDYSGDMKNIVYILAVFIIIVLFTLLPAGMLRNKIIPAQIALYAACIAGLTVYEYRKKSVVPETGFYIIITLLLIVSILNAYYVLSKKSIDIKYLLRCLTVMAFVAIIINALLGTYWCTIMYGNTFKVYFVPRLIKNLMQLPINTMLAYVIIREIRNKNIDRYILRT